MKFLNTKFLTKLNLLLVVMLAFAGTNTLKAQLSGTYTIDASKSASSTNYTSFADAVGDLMSGSRSSGTANGPGVKGAVKFSVADGTYDETVELDSTLGTTSTRTITFESASGDSSKVILRDTVGTFTIHLNGADNIIFQKMTLVHSYTNGDVIFLENYADSNRFLNNRIIGNHVTSFSYPPLSLFGEDG
ncbi:MAG: hypothetical protein NTX03_04040 [Bacteroidetes bacterium]|nr:hypothetical protein [Bacteroidota bacterium]